MTPLPMAPSGCELNDTQLAEQLARYHRLKPAVLSVDRAGQQAQLRFHARVDTRLLEQALAVERRCCSFLTLNYQPSTRVLTVETAAAHADALAVLLTALSPAAPTRS